MWEPADHLTSKDSGCPRCAEQCSHLPSEHLDRRPRKSALGRSVYQRHSTLCSDPSPPSKLPSGINFGSSQALDNLCRLNGYCIRRFVRVHVPLYQGLIFRTTPIELAAARFHADSSRPDRGSALAPILLLGARYAFQVSATLSWISTLRRDFPMVDGLYGGAMPSVAHDG